MTELLPPSKAEEYLNEISQSGTNKKCVSCMNPSREWACVYHGIFLCLSCAAQCKHLKQNICYIKSVNLDSWSEKDISILREGGNQKFIDFMDEYNLNTINFNDRLCTRAALYYRQKLQASINGIKHSEAPGMQQGRMIIINKRIESVDKQQSTFMDTTKSKLSSAYDKTKRFTAFTFGKIGQKVNSQDFKQGVSNFGTKTKDIAVTGFNKTKAGFSYLYDSIKNKISKK